MSPVPQTLPTRATWPCFAEHPARSADPVRHRRHARPDRRRPEEAAFPRRRASCWRRSATRYALVACICGRAGGRGARRIVGHRSLTYVGNHGLERARARAPRGRGRSGAGAARRRGCGRSPTRITRTGSRGARRAARGQGRDLGLPLARRAGRDGARSAARARRRGGRARRASSRTGGAWCSRSGRRSAADKGTAVAAALAGAQVERALYAGDDTTDLDAFRKLRALAGRAGAGARGLRRRAVAGRARGRSSPRRTSWWTVPRASRAARRAGGLRPVHACATPTSSRQPCS